MAAALQDVCKFVELQGHVCVMQCLIKIHSTIGIISASCFYSSQILEIHLFSQNVGHNLCTFLSLWFLTKAQVSPEQVALGGQRPRCEHEMESAIKGTKSKPSSERGSLLSRRAR